MGAHGDCLAQGPAPRAAHRLGDVLRRAAQGEADPARRYAGRDRSVAAISRPVAQYHRPRGAGRSAGGRDPGKGEPEGVHLGTGQGTAHRGRCVGGPALERRRRAGPR